MNQPPEQDNHPAIASLSEMVRLRYAARELTGFPRGAGAADDGRRTPLKLSRPRYGLR